ncbi:MAG: hypothetical protein ACYCYF_04335 [Anaerolineae bacterium]
MTETENRWMPPSPHRERILGEIASGAAHIVERGHGIPPLLVFEDGGMIELPRVRLHETRRGLQLSAAEEPASRGETRFYDVCGTVDEILGQVREGMALDQKEMSALVDDIRYMLERMARRAGQYAAFFDGVREIVETAEALPRPATASAGARLHALNTSLDRLNGGKAPDSMAVTVSAESVRALAQASEDYLAECRRASVRIGELLDEIRGGRQWAPGNSAIPRPDDIDALHGRPLGSAEDQDGDLSGPDSGPAA